MCILLVPTVWENEVERSRNGVGSRLAWAAYCLHLKTNIFQECIALSLLPTNQAFLTAVLMTSWGMVTPGTLCSVRELERSTRLENTRGYQNTEGSEESFSELGDQFLCCPQTCRGEGVRECPGRERMQAEMAEVRAGAKNL